MEMFVNTTDRAWRFDIPLRGADPGHVRLDVRGNTLRVRVESSEVGPGRPGGFEHALAVPSCLDLGRLRMSHRDGHLQVTVPLRTGDGPGVHQAWMAEPTAA
jgi:HSP20 family molecular chaperone IbpA